MEGKLSIVATPIGNLEDMTLRGLRVLREADAVFCEDTRVSGKLLSHYEIQAELKRCDAHKERVCAEKIIELLKEGGQVAYVSDAGTPGVSDPGAHVVRAVREALPEATIETIPGASALTAALAISGVGEPDFVFLGFLPHKKGRQTLFKEIAESSRTTMFYESPHRIEKTLTSLGEVLGDDRRVLLFRELTKIHEEVIEGTSEEVLQVLTEYPEKLRGELVVMVV